MTDVQIMGEINVHGRAVRLVRPITDGDITFEIRVYQDIANPTDLGEVACTLASLEEAVDATLLVAKQFLIDVVQQAGPPWLTGG